MNKNMNTKLWSILIAGLMAGGTVLAADGSAAPQAGDPISKNLFPPELVMQNQKAIALSDDQAKAIHEAMQKTMSKFSEIQWQRSAQAEKLGDLLKQDKVDEKQAAEELDKLLNIESAAKRLQFDLMLMIKNTLTAEQQAKLQSLKQ